MLHGALSDRRRIEAEISADRAKQAARPMLRAKSRSIVSSGTGLLAGVDGRSSTFRRFRDSRC
jgi:hypothetical protein